MKKSQILGLSIAAGAGLIAFVGMRSVVNQPPKTIVQSEVVDATQVLVARADIGLGQLTDEQSFRWQDWPTAAVSPSFITKNRRPNAVSDLKNSVARSAVLSGEPITSNKLIQSGKGGVLAAILPAGMRAIATKITDQTAVGKMILPNDHVDVILTQRKRTRSGGDEQISDTLFENVRVLAIGQQIEPKSGKANAEGNVATLEMTPRQAEMMALANSQGEISLSLRSVADIGLGNGPTDNDPSKRKAASSAIDIIRYGVKARAYGVN